MGEVKKVSQERGYTCLSTKCPTPDTFLTFKCMEGHIFTTREFSHTHQITCPKCHKKLEKCAEYAKSHNGFSIINNNIYRKSIK